MWGSTPSAIFSPFRSKTPQLYADVDRVKANKLDVPVGNIFDTLQVYLGSSYVNDFNLFGRTFQVRAQAEGAYRDRAEEHTAWTQRIHATLFHQGVPSLAGRLGDPQVRARLAADGAGMGLSPAGAQAVAVALRRMDALGAELGPVHARITAFARRQAGCKTLARELFGVGPLVAAIVRAFLGDTRRFSSSNRTRSTRSEGSRSVSPDSSTVIRRTICRTMISMCLSWIATACRR